MKKALFIAAVTIIVAAIPLATGILFFNMVPIVYCGTPQHAPDIPWWFIALAVAGVILSFPLGWICFLPGFSLWLIPVALLANGLFWGQLLWHLRLWVKRRKKE